jgi:putative RNA 2'-phosphotransferase
MKPELIRTSKFLSLVLRHQPDKIGLDLDPNGWADVSELLVKANSHGIHFDRSLLEEVVETNEKKRFSFNTERTKIRAVQGHSINIDLELKPTEPPELLYHGTALRFFHSIKKTGLERKGRQYVHLSPDYDTANKVGLRHGSPVVLTIDCKKMYEEGYVFYQSENGVWLTDSVPYKFVVGVV